MEKENQITLTLSDLWSVFTTHLLPVLTAGVLTFLIVLSYSLISYKPVYKSTAMIYLLRQESEGSAGTVSTADFSLALSTVNDCKILLTSHKVINEVINVLGMPITYGELQSMISISNPTQSRILEISITAPSPMDAKIIVDKLCTIGAESIMETLGIDQVNLVDEGTYNVKPANQMVTALTPVAALLVMVVVYGIFVLMYVLDDKIKTPDDVERYLGLTVLGLIPNIGGEMGGKYGKYGKYGRYGKKYGKYNAKY